MKTLIVFESIEGQTKKIVDAIAAQITVAGYSCDLVNTADNHAAPNFGSVDKIIVAAPVHERRHPKTFETWLAANGDAIKNHSTLFISVSLKAAFADCMDEAEDFATEMQMRTGLKPDKTLLVAGAVRSGSYDYFQSQVVQNVLLSGHDISLVDGEREFTDWQALTAEITAFLESENK